MPSDTQITQPVAPAIAARVAVPIAPATGESSAAAQTSSAASSAATSQENAGSAVIAPPLGFQVQFDPQTQQMIIEARDPASGFVVFQSPPQTAFSAINGSAPPRTRGQSIDQDA
jgi:hypothetical protein